MAAVADVYQSLKAALDIFKATAPETDDVPSKKALIQAAEQVKNDAAKSECHQHNSVDKGSAQKVVACQTHQAV